MLVSITNIYSSTAHYNFDRTNPMFLSSIKDWAPFHLDLSIGRLARNSFTEGLPLLATHTITSNSITKPIPGFVLYNISDGIQATDVTGWFCRWLLRQNFTFASSTVSITLRSSQVSKKWDMMSNYAVTLLTLGPLIVLAVLIGDWWGLANAIAMIVSVVIRRIIVGQNRAAIDLAATKSRATSAEIVKTFWTLPNGTSITVIAPRGVVLDCLLTTPRSMKPQRYNFARGIGWIAFGCHVVALGMTSLFLQLFSIAVLLIATVLVVHGVGDDETCIGSQLSLQRIDSPGKDFRAAAYARLNLTETQEASMVQWNLFPHKSNERWWARYRDCVSENRTEAFEEWDKLLATPLEAPEEEV